MTPPDITRTWTWTDGSDRTTLPDWLDRHHHWHHDRPVIHTTDGPRTLYDGWIVIGWSDGAITVASATVAERVYGDQGIAGRLERAETELARQAQETATWRATANALDAGGPGTPRNRAEQAEAALARIQALADRWDNALGIDKTYARTLRAALDARPADDTRPTRRVHVTVTNPDEFTANRSALCITDFLRAEFPFVHVTTDAREWEQPGPG